MERATKHSTTVLALDEALEDVPRYWPLGLRFQVVNQVPYPLSWEPRLEWSADGVAYHLVPEDLTEGVPFRLGDARNARHGQAIPPEAFVLPSEGDQFQAGVLYESTNPAPAWTLVASGVTEVEFVVRATSDALWQGTYYFRLVDNAEAPSPGDPQVIIISERPPEPTPAPLPAQPAAGALAESYSSPHADLVFDTSTCAACHRVHTSIGPQLLTFAQGNELCLSCHDGTGANSDILAEYEDPSVPPNDPETGLFYSHPLTPGRSADAEDLSGQLNRRSSCTDCHNPHTLTGDRPVASPAGWTAPGALRGATGVALAPTPYAWKESIDYEYELCLKCHSAFTELLTYPKPSQQKTDKLADIDPTLGGSYHPVAGPGSNDSQQMARSLAGGSLWQFSTEDSVRCVNCHASYAVLSDGGQPAPGDRLAPHASRYPGLLIAEYRSRPLKPPAETNDYDPAEFALCFLCHSATPFADQSGDGRSDTRFSRHGFHLNRLYDEYEGEGPVSLDINEPGAGGGNAICAECHFRIHSTRSSVHSVDQGNRGLVNFAPNVLPEPESGEGPTGGPDPERPQRASCTLLCHGEPHRGWRYDR